MAPAVASVLDSRIRSLPARATADDCPVVREWTLTGGGGTAAALRVDGEVRRVLPDGSEQVDDAETYSQLLGLAGALTDAGFVVEEVYEGWRTVAVDVRPAVPAEPAVTPKQEKVKVKAKKVKPVKAPKAKEADEHGTAAPGEPDAEPAPKKARVGLLRRRAPESSTEPLADDAADDAADDVADDVADDAGEAVGSREEAVPAQLGKELETAVV